jgi:protoheme IX farnesyltransferase
MSTISRQTANAATRTDGLLRTLLAKANGYWMLTKPEVNVLVVASTGAAFYLASNGHIQWLRAFHTLAGTVLVAIGTATLNEYMERSDDAEMRRTAKRPLPSGRLNPAHALLFGIGISILGTLQLWLGANPLTSTLAALTLLSYLLIYTPLKKKTAWCTFVGAFPGAMPTLIGWAAARGNLTAEAWVLFAVVFFWQFPHFLSIAWIYRADYSRAGLRMLPGWDTAGIFTAGELAALTLVLIVVSIVPTLLHYEGRLYAVGAVLTGVWFLGEGARMALQRSRAAAKRVLHVSVIYLPLLFALMMFDTRNW